MNYKEIRDLCNEMSEIENTHLPSVDRALAALNNDQFSKGYVGFGDWQGGVKLQLKDRASARPLIEETKRYWELMLAEKRARLMALASDSVLGGGG